MKAAFFILVRLFLDQWALLLLPYILLTGGHAILNLSYGVFSGLHQDFFQQMESQHPHLTLLPNQVWFKEQPDLYPLPNAAIRSQSPVFLSQGIVNTSGYSRGILLRGLPDFQSETWTLKKASCPPSKAMPSIWPESLYNELKQPCEAELTLLDGSHHKTRVQAVFADYHIPEKRLTLFLKIQDLQDSLLGEAWFNRYELYLKDPTLSEAARELLQNESPHFQIQTWQQRYSETLSLFRIQKELHAIVFVAMTCFILLSLRSCVLLIYLQKQDSLRSLLWLGMRRQNLLRALGAIHLLLSAVSLLGSLCLWAVCAQLLETFPIHLPPSLFYSPTLPLNPSPYFFCTTGLLLVLLVVITTRQAQRQLPGPVEEETL